MKIQRNKPCPCGSGKKYKKCCARITQEHPLHQELRGNIPARSPLSGTVQQTESRQAQSRACGSCALCCQGWLTTNALGHDIYVGKPCPYTSGTGCDIHETRPEEPCRAFFCGWVEATSELPSWMKPDLCGVIVLPGRVYWRKSPVDVLVSAGKDPDQRILSWFQQRSMEKMKPFIYQQKQQWFGFGPQSFQVDIAAKINRGEALWDGSLDAIRSLEPIT